MPSPSPHENQLLLAFFASLKGLDATYGIRLLAVNVAKHQELLQKFTFTHLQDGEKVRSALAQENMVQAQFPAHTLKACASTLGLSLIQQAAITIEQPLKQAIPDTVATIRPELQHLDRLLLKLADALAQHPPDRN